MVIKKKILINICKNIYIVNDKISFVNEVSELINDSMGSIDVNTSNDIALQKLKEFKNYIVKSINSLNSYIKIDTKNNTEPGSKNNTKKKDTKNNTEPDTKNKTKPYTKDDIESNINDIRASIRKNQITVKNRYKNLLETEKTIRNNILVYSGLKKLPSESHSKANELIKLDTILNDSINVIWRENHERDKKVMKKIDKK